MNRRILTTLFLAATFAVAAVAPAGAAGTPSTSDAAGIQELQRDLNALGCNAGNVDGTLGPATVQAVRWFQTAAKLNVDGIVGPATTAALTQAAAAGTPTCTGVPAPAPVNPTPAGPPCNVDQIKAGAQKALLPGESLIKSGPYQCAGDYVYNAPTVQAAGGKPTQVIELMKWNGTGWQAVDRSIYCQAGSVPKVIYPQTCLGKGVPAKDNVNTSDGAQVQLMQRQLNALGCGPVNVDGSFGPATVNAVKWFQTAAKLNPDGMVGPLTSAALTQAAIAGTPKCTSVPKPTAVTTTTAGKGVPCTAAAIQTAAQASLSPGETITKSGPFQCAVPWAYNGPTIKSGGTETQIPLLMHWDGTAWQVVDRNAYCEAGGVPTSVANLACQTKA